MEQKVVLRSLPHGIDITVSKDRILQLFPNSILAQAITTDPDVDTIDIPSPHVTPISLFVLKYVLDTGTVPLINDQLMIAANYLGTDTISLMAHPKLPLFREKNFGVSIVAITPDTYPRFMDFALQNNAPEFAITAMRSVPANETEKLDEKFLVEAITNKRPEIIEWLLHRGADPTANGYEALIAAVKADNSDAVKRLLSDSRVSPATFREYWDQIPDPSGRNPRMNRAQWAKRTELLKLIETYNPKISS